MDIKTFNLVATKLPPEIAILLRGPTGVGKSFLAAQVAKSFLSSTSAVLPCPKAMLVVTPTLRV